MVFVFSFKIDKNVMDLPFGSVGVEKCHQKGSCKKQQTKGKQWLEQQYVLVTSTI